MAELLTWQHYLSIREKLLAHRLTPAQWVPALLPTCSSAPTHPHPLLHPLGQKAFSLWSGFFEILSGGS